ncbi:ICOS ligand-like [Polyodon spathula]|uniref:ICOS ligand-like n=1 Tax=Polyodon spathula TaxID=7913 RepID=UPI001B7E1968|nr:ICOS ligand-like [Polyodon spathula]
MSSVWIILLLLVMLCPVMSTGSGCVLGIIRKSVIIPCEYRNEGVLERNSIAVEWRTPDSLIVHSFLHGEDQLANQDPQYKNRTKFFKTEVEHGDFSLKLSDIIPEDGTDYNCFFHKDGWSTSKHVDAICLIVADHYTEPFLSTSSHRENSEEVSFTCTSSNGFPKPIVHWFINKKEIFPEPGRENIVFDKDPSTGSFTVTSILTVNVTQDLTVTCAIENERLNETRTSAAIYYSKQKPDNSQPGSNTGVIIGVCVALAIGTLGIVVFLIYRCRNMPRRQQPQDGPEATYTAVSTS